MFRIQRVGIVISPEQRRYPRTVRNRISCPQFADYNREVESIAIAGTVDKQLTRYLGFDGNPRVNFSGKGVGFIAGVTAGRNCSYNTGRVGNDEAAIAGTEFQGDVICRFIADIAQIGNQPPALARVETAIVVAARRTVVNCAGAVNDIGSGTRKDKRDVIGEDLRPRRPSATYRQAVQSKLNARNFTLIDPG